MKRKQMRSWKRKSALAGAVLVGLVGGSTAYAMPTGGNVAPGNGNANITQQNNKMTIDQTSQRVAIDWNTFDIAKNESVRFNQPNADAVALNRVMSADASTIAGSLSADGKIILVNPNGVLFENGAKLDVAGLIASTARVSDDAMTNFVKNGSLTATIEDGNTASIINKAEIDAQGGLVALHAATVENDGAIKAGTKVSLAAAKEMKLSTDPNGLINFVVSGDVAKAKVLNKGTLSTDAGTVYMTAKGAGDALASVVNNEGVIVATKAKVGNGRVELTANGDINDSGQISVGQTAQMISENGNINITGDIDGIKRDRLTVYAKNGNVNLDTAVDIKGGAYITAGKKDIKVTKDLKASKIEMSAGNNIELNGAIGADDHANVIAANDISADQRITAKGDVKVQSLYAGDITLHGVTAENGSVLIRDDIVRRAGENLTVEDFKGTLTFKAITDAEGNVLDDGHISAGSGAANAIEVHAGNNNVLVNQTTAEKLFAAKNGNWKVVVSNPNHIVNLGKSDSMNSGNDAVWRAGKYYYADGSDYHMSDPQVDHNNRYIFQAVPYIDTRLTQYNKTYGDEISSADFLANAGNGSTVSEDANGKAIAKFANYEYTVVDGEEVKQLAPESSGENATHFSVDAYSHLYQEKDAREYVDGDYYDAENNVITQGRDADGNFIRPIYASAGFAATATRQDGDSKNADGTRYESVETGADGQPVVIHNFYNVTSNSDHTKVKTIHGYTISTALDRGFVRIDPAPAQAPDVTPEVPDYREQDASAAMTNSDGTASITDGRNAGVQGVDRVLGLADAQLPFFKNQGGSVTNYGSYEVSVDPSSVKLSPVAKVLPDPNRPQTQYRSYAKAITTSYGTGTFNLVYDGSRFIVTPADEAAQRVLVAGDAAKNIEVTSQALLAGFNNMGLMLDGIDAVYVNFN